MSVKMDKNKVVKTKRNKVVNNRNVSTPENVQHVRHALKNGVAVKEKSSGEGGRKGKDKDGQRLME